MNAHTERRASREVHTRPPARTHRLLQPDGSTREVVGQLLGFGTSQREYHNHPVPRDLERYPVTWKCSACRWFEVTLLWVPTDRVYAVYTVGHSALEDEQPRARIQFTESAFEIIEMLTDRRDSATPRLPIAAARCLAQAANVDDAITEAYVNRAVV